MLSLLLGVTASIIIGINDASITMENRLTYLEGKMVSEVYALERKIYDLNEMLSELSSNPATSSELSEKVKQVEMEVDNFLERQQNRFWALQMGLQDIKMGSKTELKQLVERSVAESQRIDDIVANLDTVKGEIVTGTDEREQLKIHFDKNTANVLKDLNVTVNKMKKELETAVGNMQNISADSNMVKLGEACPKGWLMHDRVCYLYDTSIKLSWHGASVKCFMENGKLAEPQTKSAMNFLLKLVKNDVWLGARDEANEGVWIWDSSQNQVENLLWQPGQPNNIGGRQSCLEIYSHQHNDESCAVENHYICEKEVFLHD